jgi:hypothetical protein
MDQQAVQRFQAALAELTPQEHHNLGMLQHEGYDAPLILQVYIACDRNIEATREVLRASR